MRAVAIIGGALLLGIVLAMQDSKTPSTDLVGKGDRVLLIGDSLAVGLVMPMRALAQKAGIPFHGMGKTGSTIDQWAGAPLGMQLSFHKPTVVLVSLGTNDMKASEPSKARIQDVIAQIRGAGALTIWIVPPTMPFPDKGVRDLILSSGTALVRADRLTLERATDGVHMTVAGYKALADAVWQCITSGTCP